MISRTTIDAVFDAARVEEVVGDFVQLKKSGSNYKGLSPFSEERTPSFMVSPVKQIWKDFSSGKGGTAVSFIMEHEHFTYPEAIRYLAKKYNIEIEEKEQTSEQKVAQDTKEAMFSVSKYAAGWFVDQLKTERGRSIAYSYFKERGFTDATMEYFQLGYNPDEWSAFTDAALKAGYQLEYLEKTGLTIVKENSGPGEAQRKFDRFKGRVMFPIRSLSGRVLGFGGRILDNSKKAAKYLNSPQSDIYDKSQVLYGIYEAKQSIAREDICYLVEGYTDVIQLHQAGIKNVVSSSGTALTAQQIRLIQRLTKNITVLYDGDAAGLRAAIRGTDLILEAGMNVRVCTFPQGEDPDSYARAHTEQEIKDFLAQNAVDFISFKSNLLKQEAAGDPIKRSEMVRDIIQSIALIPDSISREIYVRESAAILDVNEETLFAALAQQRNAQIKQVEKEQRSHQRQQGMTRVETPALKKVDRKSVLESTMLGLLLQYGGRIEEFTQEYLQDGSEGELVYETATDSMAVYEKFYFELHPDEIQFASPDFRELFQKVIDIYLLQGKINTNIIISHLDDDQAQRVAGMVMDNEQYALHKWHEKQIYVKTPEDAVATAVLDSVLNFRRLILDEMIVNLMANLKDEDSSATLQEIMDYTRLKQNISRQLNRVV
ncbi:MAG: DNA primase [Nonlabens sp.]